MMEIKLLLEDQAKKLIKNNDVEAIRLALVAQMDKAGLEYLEEGKNEIWELLNELRDNFDGSEHMQGKKDGLRQALAFLGNVQMGKFNRGGSMARAKGE